MRVIGYLGSTPRGVYQGKVWLIIKKPEGNVGLSLSISVFLDMANFFISNFLDRCNKKRKQCEVIHDPIPFRPTNWELLFWSKMKMLYGLHLTAGETGDASPPIDGRLWIVVRRPHHHYLDLVHASRGGSWGYAVIHTEDSRDVSPLS
jgi:hypothetical protein